MAWCRGDRAPFCAIVRRPIRLIAEFRLPSGEIVQAELHWYEATGIGKREMKIEAFI
jgi:hypothetical protein